MFYAESHYAEVYPRRYAVLPQACGYAAFSPKYGQAGYVPSLETIDDNTVKLDVCNGQEKNGRPGYHTVTVTFVGDEVTDVRKSHPMWMDGT